MYTNLETALCPIHYRCLTLLIAPTSASWWGVGATPDPAGLPAAYEQLATGTRAANSRFWLQDIRRRTLNDPVITA